MDHFYFGAAEFTALTGADGKSWLVAKSEKEKKAIPDAQESEGIRPLPAFGGSNY